MSAESNSPAQGDAAWLPSDASFDWLADDQTSMIAPLIADGLGSRAIAGENGNAPCTMSDGFGCADVDAAQQSSIHDRGLLGQRASPACGVLQACSSMMGADALFRSRVQPNGRSMTQALTPRPVLPDGALLASQSAAATPSRQRPVARMPTIEISTNGAHRPQLVDGLFVQDDMIVIIDLVVQRPALAIRHHALSPEVTPTATPPIVTRMGRDYRPGARRA